MDDILVPRKVCWFSNNFFVMKEASKEQHNKNKKNWIF